ncbi:unnamed protein product [Vitrella brassicaformis CCMP3155]|uniref:UBA domain-containing protein n=2 Tax=Vitrella brassicaformis TaxID=1169539 RepID=A0A0G4GFP6_VITBC|nr:unnamed protein product [Vitrella brassicaformis CCMP3155]|mmetsp:Transcript_34110/g.84391  ORF Transcript_34110/g.84391 Transcript_34110/m.84391 type:complete len:522 (+) Transcript_34110:144-1709(+)|eukprot:CEM28126.1 unnamed protein product [Vitrella brassicaformis CCMP3155]
MVPTSSPSSSAAAAAAAAEGPTASTASQYVLVTPTNGTMLLKVDFQGDIRRFRLPGFDIASSASPAKYYELIIDTLTDSYEGLNKADVEPGKAPHLADGYVLKYLDEEGEYCTLTPSTTLDAIQVAHEAGDSSKAILKLKVINTKDIDRERKRAVKEAKRDAKKAAASQETEGEGEQEQQQQQQEREGPPPCGPMGFMAMMMSLLNDPNTAASMARGFLQNVSESIDSHAERINEAAVDYLPQITERLQRIGTQLEQTTATVHGMSEAAIDREALTHNLEAFTAGVRSLVDGTSVAVADVLKALVKAVDGIATAALQYALELLQVIMSEFASLVPVVMPRFAGSVDFSCGAPNQGRPGPCGGRGGPCGGKKGGKWKAHHKNFHFGGRHHHHGWGPRGFGHRGGQPWGGMPMPPFCGQAWGYGGMGGGMMPPPPPPGPSAQPGWDVELEMWNEGPGNNEERSGAQTQGQGEGEGDADQQDMDRKLQLLSEMGFENQDLNREILKMKGGDIRQAVVALTELTQ